MLELKYETITVDAGERMILIYPNYCGGMPAVNAITMKDGKPVWTQGNCAMCLGCLHRCPKFAIQYDDATKNHGQYQHPDEAH